MVVTMEYYGRNHTAKSLPQGADVTTLRSNVATCEPNIAMLTTIIILSSLSRRGMETQRRNVDKQRRNVTLTTTTISSSLSGRDVEK